MGWQSCLAALGREFSNRGHFFYTSLYRVPKNVLLKVFSVKSIHHANNTRLLLFLSLHEDGRLVLQLLEGVLQIDRQFLVLLRLEAEQFLKEIGSAIN